MWMRWRGCTCGVRRTNGSTPGCGLQKGISEDMHRSCDQWDPNERVRSFRCLGVHVYEELSWTLHSLITIHEARQSLPSPLAEEVWHLCHPSTLPLESLSVPPVPHWGHHHRVCGNCSAENPKALQRMVRSSERIVNSGMSPHSNVYSSRFNQISVQEVYFGLIVWHNKKHIFLWQHCGVELMP